MHVERTQRGQRVEEMGQDVRGRIYLDRENGTSLWRGQGDKYRGKKNVTYLALNISMYKGECTPWPTVRDTYA